MFFLQFREVNEKWNNMPILVFQVENEYGAYGCDINYLIKLRDMFARLLVDDVVLLTNDYPEVPYIGCGNVPGMLVTGKVNCFFIKLYSYH